MATTEESMVSVCQRGHHPQLVDSHGFLISFPSTKFWASAASASPDHDRRSHWNMSLPPCHSQHSCRSPGSFWDSQNEGVMISPSKSMDIWKGFISLHTGTFKMLIYDLKKRENVMYVCIFRYIDIDTMYVCYMCVFCSMRWWGSTRLYFPPGTCGRPVQRRGAGLQAECALGVSKVWIVSPSGGIKPIMIGI